MKNIRKWGAWLGAGAVMVTLAGCADTNNNGQADTPAADTSAAVKDNIEDTGQAVVKGADKAADAATGAVEGAVKGADKAVDAAGNAVEGVAKGADKAVDAAGNAVEGAGAAVAKGADKAAAVAAGAGTAVTLTPKIKSALLANNALNTATINVDTLPAKNSIALRGTVKSASQKNLAAQIAKKEAPGMTIVNQLVVKP